MAIRESFVNSGVNKNQLVLITGGAGFIGRALSRALLLQGSSVRVLDNFGPQTHAIDRLPDDLTQNVDLVKADVRDRDAVRQALKGVDVVVHLAAETGTGQSMYEIERYFSVNVQGTANLLELLQNDPCGDRVHNVVVASSRAIYGEGSYRCADHGAVFPDQRSRTQMQAGHFEPTCPHCNSAVQLMPTPESAPFKPMSVYGLTKQVQEQSVLMFGRTRGINAFGLRYQNVYGPGQSLKNPYTGILAVFSNLARQHQTIEIYEDGCESRDFVYIDDVVAATLSCVNYSNQYIGPLNVGSGRAVSVLEVARNIKAFFNSESSIGVTGAFRVGDIRHNVADISEAKKVIGFNPQTHFEKGLYQFLIWAHQQPLEDKAAYLRSVNELSAKGLMGNRASLT